VISFAETARTLAPTANRLNGRRSHHDPRYVGEAMYWVWPQSEQR
jgi:hypothetical protein